MVEKEEKKWEEYYPLVIVPGQELNPEEDIRTRTVVPSYFEAEGRGDRSPLFTWYATKYWAHGMKYADFVLNYPYCKGMEWGHHKGGIYLSPNIVRDEEEIEQRMPEFQKRMRPWFENFDGVWAERKKELKKGFEEIKSFDFDRARREAPWEIVHWLHRNRTLYARMWEIHFEAMNPCFNAFMLLAEMAKPYGMTTTSPEYQKMMTGFDNELFQIQKQLWEFGVRAREEGLEPIFRENDPKNILPKLKGSEAGARWTQDFLQFLDEYGWIPLYLMEFTCPYWREDPSIPLTTIKSHLEKGVEWNLPEIRERIAEEREKAIATFLAKVPPGERKIYEELIRLAGKAGAIGEEHDYYCEYNYHAALRYGYLQLAQVLVKAGTIEQPEDIFFLIPDEIEAVAMAPEYNNLRRLVKIRRDMCEEWAKVKRPPVFTGRSGMEEAVGMDMIPCRYATIVLHIVGELPVVKPELKADLFGVCGSAGEAEGSARVIMRYEDLDQIQKGDILVSVSTDSSWTHVFPLLKGVITDRGGSLSHPSCVGREFGIPVVVNTFVATQKIKTGQHVRISADEGAVYILDK
jgi:pyruvate,water dikinase